MSNSCPICGSSHLWSVPYDRMPEVEAILARRKLASGYGWFLCRRCGNATPSEQPDRDVLSEYWQNNRTTVTDSAAWDYRRKIARIGADRSWELFAPQYTGARPGRFLDIGCGLGVTVRRFQDGGWTATGIDADATTKASHLELGVETTIGQIEDQSWPERFDLVQIAYAIYFITEPVSYLRRLHGILTPDGTLAIVIADLLSSVQKGGPSYLHTWLPTAASLQYTLAEAGYVTVLSKTVKGSHFIAARRGSAPRPRVSADLTLLRHRTRDLRWWCIGAPRAKLKAWVAPLIGR